MKLDANFVESRLLPIVCAFGLGVLIADLAAERRDAVRVQVSDNLIVGIECVPDVPGAPVWLSSEVKP